jgi:hypothetical protein
MHQAHPVQDGEMLRDGLPRHRKVLAERRRGTATVGQQQVGQQARARLAASPAGQQEAPLAVSVNDGWAHNREHERDQRVVPETAN